MQRNTHSPSSPSLQAFAREGLEALEAQGRRRTLTPTTRRGGGRAVRADREYISFSCNDYLGLSHHPEVIAAAREALEAYGAGAGASRLVTGNHPPYAELEMLLAEIKGEESACVFGSGYLANIGIITALAGEDDLIVADKLIHACMLDGAKLSGAKLLRFTHNDVSHARKLLEAHRGAYRRCLLLTETVFSMEGDLAPMRELRALTEEYNTWLIADDAHGLGIIPHGGYADITTGTLSKSAGSYGGYVCGKKEVMDYIKTSSRSLMFSTGLPPAAVAAATTALRIMQDSSVGAKTLKNARYFSSLLNLPVAQSAIVPVLLGDEARTLAAGTMLETHGYLASTIRPPTVPPGTSRLRFSFSALHAEADIARVASLLKKDGYA